MTVIDCTTPPPFDAMRAAGVTGLCRYLSWVKLSTDFKRITQPEYDGLRAAGFDIVLNWEYAATDWLGGATAGAQHAAEAVKQARGLGYPAGCAIPGSADFNMTAGQWDSAGRAYAQAYSAGIRSGGYVAGVYGPWDVLTWCQQLGGFGMYWQAGMSTSWSGGRNANPWPGAHLRQRRSGFVGGYDVDFNDQLQAWYGQYGVDAASITAEDDEMDLINITRPDGSNKTGLVDPGYPGGFHWIEKLDALKVWRDAHPGVEPIQVTEDQALQIYGVVLDPPPAATVAMTDADRQVIIAGFVAGAPKPATAAEIADELAARLKA